MDLEADFAAAVARQKAGDLVEAEAAYGAILSRAEHPPSLNNLGVILEADGRVEAAGDLYRRAAEGAPRDHRYAFGFAAWLRKARRFDEAELAFRRLLAVAPDYPMAAFSLGCVLIAKGCFEEGWALYDSRPIRQRLLAGLKLPEWDGKPLGHRRLLIWREQGFGDQILAARFLAQLDGAAVTYAGPEALRRLFEPLPVAFIADAARGFDLSPYDCWVLPMSLPARLGARVEVLPAPPYLTGRTTAATRHIGIAWRGEPENPNDRFRSLSRETATRLLNLPGAISLEPADTGATDFQATADIIAGLDLVITVDTSVAHLAGAMGKDTWVLLAAYADDWQWPREGRSPWYPGVRLFTQPRPGDWDSLISEVCREVSARIAGLSPEDGAPATVVT